MTTPAQRPAPDAPVSARPTVSIEWGWLRDPGNQAFIALLVMFLVGWSLIGLGWSGAARTGFAPLQTPYLVSGGVFGLAVIALAALSWNIHLGRRLDALANSEFEIFVREASEIAEGLRTGAIPLHVEADPPIVPAPRSAAKNTEVTGPIPITVTVPTGNVRVAGTRAPRAAKSAAKSAAAGATRTAGTTRAAATARTPRTARTAGTGAGTAAARKSTGSTRTRRSS